MTCMGAKLTGYPSLESKVLVNRLLEASIREG
jgi:hypothetical protein